MEEKLTDLEKYLIIKIKSDFDYWQGYANVFQGKEKEFADNKEKIAKLFKESPDTEEAKRALLFAQYDYQFHQNDLKDIMIKLVALYNLADALNLTDQFTESLNQKMQRLKELDKKNVFVLDNGRLEEREKGNREKYLKEMESNPLYKDVMQFVSSKLDGE